MSRRDTISRRDFLHGLFRQPGREEQPSPFDLFDTFSSEPDWLSKLPPEFTGSMLKMEAARLGGETDAMTEQEMAALVIKAMYGTTQVAPRQEANDTALEQECVPVE